MVFYQFRWLFSGSRNVDYHIPLTSDYIIFDLAVIYIYLEQKNRQNGIIPTGTLKELAQV